jgi:large subunit ribosomal protein L25
MATKKVKLKASKRKTLGRKVKKLRREGFLPANIYGKKIKSQILQVDLKTFIPVYQEVGETGVVELFLEGESKARPVLIHNVQINPVTDQPLHVDFFQVSLKDKVTAEIPVEAVGESPAVKEKAGVMIQPLLEVEVEALPTELPDKFEVDISQLKEIDDAFMVGDLKSPKGVKILTGAKQILVKVEPPSKEEEPVPSEEAPEEEAVEGEEEAKPEAEGEKKEPAPSEKAKKAESEQKSDKGDAPSEKKDK